LLIAQKAKFTSRSSSVQLEFKADIIRAGTGNSTSASQFDCINDVCIVSQSFPTCFAIPNLSSIAHPDYKWGKGRPFKWGWAEFFMDNEVK
jgi:hypothetical protein